MKRALMIAYHFPPLAGSSGVQRTLRFVQHLPEFGWQTSVLTTHPRAYERISADLMADVPAATVVRRAFALDTARHLQLGGRYLEWMARPDRWISWRFDGVRRGMQLIRQFRPDVIWSTYPIASAHVIASALHRRTGIPWIADFRDPMAQEGYPADLQTWASYLRIEQDVMRRTSCCVFTTPGAARMYRERYVDAADRIAVLENGFDEESFAGIPSAAGPGSSAAAWDPEKPLVLLHSGVVYASERDPTQLFVAMGRLKRSGAITSKTLRVRFRAAVHESLLRDLARQHGVEDMVEICPSIPYRDALAEMTAVDALLVMQASNCNAQIPAKVYEYLRAGRPILALTDPQGDTAGVLFRAGSKYLARLDSAQEIIPVLIAFLAACRQGSAPLPRAAAVQQASRRVLTETLAALFGRALSRGARSDK